MADDMYIRHTRCGTAETLFTISEQTKRESSRETLQNLEEKLDRLCAGAAPDDVIDDAFVDALMEWLGPVEPLSNEATHYAVTQLQVAMKDDDLGRAREWLADALAAEDARRQREGE